MGASIPAQNTTHPKLAKKNKINKAEPEITSNTTKHTGNGIIDREDYRRRGFGEGTRRAAGTGCGRRLERGGRIPVRGYDGAAPP